MLGVWDLGLGRVWVQTLPLLFETLPPINDLP